MLKKVLGVVASLILVLLAYAGFQSPDYQISREIEIKTSADKIFPYLNDAQKINSWMPWAEQDPKMKLSYVGPSEGVGAKSIWTSDGSMGHGESEIIESQPQKLVKHKITYLKPMQMSQVSDMTLIPTEQGTIVRWSVQGQNNFIGRLFCLFINMDKMVGDNFMLGLNKLKTTVEAP